MWDAISAVMNSFNDFLWGWFMIILLLGTHIFLTIRTKFVQRKTFKAIKLSVTKDPDSDGDISPFQALATALASTIGTGNIIGVGTAIALGGLVRFSGAGSPVFSASQRSIPSHSSV